MALLATQPEPSMIHEDCHRTRLGTQLSPTSKSLEITSHNVTTILHYFEENEKVSPSTPHSISKTERRTKPTKPQKTVVHDIRGNESQYTLDTKGFQIVKHRSEEKSFLDDKQIERNYYPETEALLKKVTGASKVFIYNHTIHKSRGSHGAPHNPSKPLPTRRRPLHRVHIDTSYVAAPKCVAHHLSKEAPALLRGRYQIINVWRPINTILKDPLGVAEAGSVPDSDLVPIKLIYSDRGGESPEHKPDEAGDTFSVRASLGHKWCYLYGQTPGEVLLIKCFDSKTDGRARRAPHTAFVNEEHQDMPGRESIEVRALVFHPNDTE
ncbi:hypothetical protein F4802DRAFT_486880 [Xylaria palmicola]|nr:hypothetical protein F4802DRAFT_486880 [Xylaria palmicola]